ncbi:hypothetical protein WCV21_08060 [Lactobacillus helveticus]|nr:hypothetical protein [Lactobacillus helveticus]
MNDFTKNMAQALFNQDKINDLLRKELQQAVNGDCKIVCVRMNDSLN